MAQEENAVPGKKKSKLKTIIIIVLVVVFSVVLSVGATLYFLSDGTSAEGTAGSGEPAQPIDDGVPASKLSYFAFERPFIVSLSGPGTQRYLQVHLAVAMRDHDVTPHLERHAPTIRSRLQSLLARQQFDALQSDAAREALRGEILEAINGVLAEENAEAVEQVLYTNFVMQ